jgi:hypothetical protein
VKRSLFAGLFVSACLLSHGCVADDTQGITIENATGQQVAVYEGEHFLDDVPSGGSIRHDVLADFPAPTTFSARAAETGEVVASTTVSWEDLRSMQWRVVLRP